MSLLKLKKRQTHEECGVCNGTGVYDHISDDGGNMTLLMHHFDYVHWDCYDEAIRLQNEYDKRTK